MRWQKQGYSYTEASAAMPMRLWMLSSKENLNSIRMSNAIITAMVKDIHAAVTKRAEPVIRAEDTADIAAAADMVLQICKCSLASIRQRVVLYNSLPFVF